MRASEAAKIMGVSSRTVRRWLQRGVIPAKRLPFTGEYVIDADSFGFKAVCKYYEKHFEKSRVNRLKKEARENEKRNCDAE